MTSQPPITVAHAAASNAGQTAPSKPRATRKTIAVSATAAAAAAMPNAVSTRTAPADNTRMAAGSKWNCS